MLLLLGSAIAPRLPRSVLTALGVVIGVATYAVSGRARAAVLRNLKVAAPQIDDRHRRRLALRTFIHAAWSYLEQLILSPARVAAMDDEVPVTGWEHLEVALARGRGAIMVTAHVGTPSTAGQLLARRGFPTTVIVEPLRPPALFQLMIKLRQTGGLHLIPTGPSAVREILRALRHNEVVGLFGDRDVAGTGEMLPFFNRTTQISTAAATLALRTGASIVPCVAYRTQPFHAVAEIWPSIEITATGDPVTDIRGATRLVTAQLESFIQRHPEQWVVFSDIWPDASSTMAASRAQQQGSMDRR